MTMAVLHQLDHHVPSSSPSFSFSWFSFRSLFGGVYPPLRFSSVLSMQS